MVVNWCNLVWHRLSGCVYGLGECDMGVGLHQGLFAVSEGDMYSLGAVWPQLV